MCNDLLENEEVENGVEIFISNPFRVSVDNL